MAAVFNPGPLCAQPTLTCIGCKAKVSGNNQGNLEVLATAEWICDTCIDLIANHYDLDQSVDDLVQGLPKGVTFGHLNVFGLRNKLDQIKILLRNGKFDIFAITESKLDGNILDAEVQIKGYNLVRRDRNRHGGGVLVYAKEKWTISNVQIRDNMEMLSLDIKQYNSPKITIAVVYRPPDAKAKWVSTFENVVDEIMTDSSEVVILGDFNIDELKNTSFKSQMEINGLHQVINTPTRVTSHSETLIDHIYVSDKFLYLNSGIIPIGISDHHLVYTIRNKTIKENKQHVYIKYRDMKHADEYAFLSDLASTDWNIIRNLENVNDMWALFKDTFFKVIDKHFPMRERRIRADSEKWINDNILSEMRQRDFLHRRALKSKSDADWKAYKAARNRVGIQVNEAKREFVNEVIEQAHAKPKNMWDRIKEFLPSKRTQSTTTHLEVDGETITCPQEIANKFNDFFSNIGHKFASNFDNSLPTVPQQMPEGSFSIPFVSESFVIDEVLSMSNSKATGLDEISVKILKQ
ncbi:uncharacterized protein LOC134235355, partial [Saccostrea cucullata]|uniref:uncharacterized protein LOC134235355 n=1 Tax=Saccostrea cuccullata TaxID=36930 RepID=UPI002ED3D8F0